MKDEWVIQQEITAESAELSQSIGCTSVTAAVMMNRGIKSPELASAFLNPSLSEIGSPFRMKDMEKAVNRITDAIRNRQQILIFGDYDVDGITATTILYHFLKEVGATVSFYIPHRLNEGYSFHSHHVDSVLIPEKTELMITVDCGIDSVSAVEYANDKKIDVIITDHHSVPDTCPPAIAILNPKQADCPSGLEQLAGVGVAFYLLIALRKHLRDIGFWQNREEPNLKSYCDLVALGTIGDIVPLTGVNRIITRTGIDVINTAPREGIRAMIASGRINKSTIDSTDIAFKIAPRMNAAGRIDHASMVVHLLTGYDKSSIKPTAETLNDLNTARQRIEHEIFDEIETHISNQPAILEKKAIILFKQGWHTGILGIVASKLVSRYHRPVILIALDGDVGKGSGRSVSGANLYTLLNQCSDLLDGFGGHAMAAGLSIQAKNIKNFTSTFETLVATQLPESAFMPRTHIDCRIGFDDISPVLLDELDSLHPFGAGNREPLFIADNITICSSTIVGTRHRRLILTSESSSSDIRIMAMHFNAADIDPYPDHFSHLVFKLHWNYWNNSRSMQIIVEDFL